MKGTWPDASFMHYGLQAGNKRSPMLTAPGEVFYHGEPWPPEVAHSPHPYADMFPEWYLSATGYTGTVETILSSTSFRVQTGSPFVDDVSYWASLIPFIIRFEGNVTPGLAGREVAASSWNPTTRDLEHVPMTTSIAAGDRFRAFVETDLFRQWFTNDVGWHLWPAYKARYNHTGTLAEIYRKTSMSWAAESVERLCAAWPDRQVIPYMQRYAETEGAWTFSDEHMYPDPSIMVPPGMQTRADWIGMVSRCLLAGVPRFGVFEGGGAQTANLDAWTEIIAGVQSFYTDSRQAYEVMAPHPRNRDFRKRHLWRS
jgi:hypothetical protein